MPASNARFTRMESTTNQEVFEVVTFNHECNPDQVVKTSKSPDGGKMKRKRKQSIPQDLITGKKKEEYIQSLSIHGLTKICRGTRAESLFWLVVFLIGISLTSFIVSRLITKYLRYDIYSEFYQKNTVYNDFPSITFCNEMMLLGSYFKYCGEDHWLGTSDEPCKKKVKFPETRKNLLKNQEKEWSNGYFHVRLCESVGKNLCSNDQHLLSVNKHNHACFTWNHNGSFHDVYSQVSLEFHLNKSTTFPKGKILAFVHEPEIVEIDYTNKISLEPSKTYQLKIRKTNVIRLPAPFPSNCVKSFDEQIFAGKYTRRMCIDSINYINMYKLCGDVMDYHRELIPKHIVNKYKQNISIKQAVECFREFSQTKVPITDECPFPCEEIEYQTSAISHSLDSRHDKPDELIYRLEIQLENIDSYDVVEEKQLFTWGEILGEIGGLIGLLVGASIISLIEVLAYVYLAVIQKCVNACGNEGLQEQK